MKKIVSLALVLMMILTCTVAFASCNNNKEVAGVYEMVSITGTITQNGQVQQLSTDLYEYYRITLNEDGTAKIESKAPNSSQKLSEDGTWELDGEELLLTSAPQGISVVEIMTLKDGTITYVVENQLIAQNTYMSMTLVLQKQ